MPKFPSFLDPDQLRRLAEAAGAIAPSDAGGGHTHALEQMEPFAQAAVTASHALLPAAAVGLEPPTTATGAWPAPFGDDSGEVGAPDAWPARPGEAWLAAQGFAPALTLLRAALRTGRPWPPGPARPWDDDAWVEALRAVTGLALRDAVQEEPWRR